MRLANVYGCAALLLVSLTTGCSIKHHIADDYGQYLRNNEGAASFQRINAGDKYHLPPSTQNHQYEFRAATVGYANLWIVEFGKILDQTMQSKDIVAALGLLSKVGDNQIDTGNTLIFDLERYTFEDFGAHVNLTIIVKQSGHEKFRKSYRADGKTQGGKMFFAGAFGMKNAVQQSTKLALDDIFSRFISDYKASSMANQ